MSTKTATAILYQNGERDVTLIDIPTSITVAQDDNFNMLLSTSPLEEPFTISNEPKTSNAKQKHSNYASTPLHDYYRAVIDAALRSIREHISESWCLPRKLMIQASPIRHLDIDMNDPDRDLDERLKEWSASKEEEDAFDYEKMMASLVSNSNATSMNTVPQQWTMSYNPVSETRPPDRGESVSPQEPWMSTFHNPNHHALQLTIFHNTAQAAPTLPHYRFRIPPRASFFLTDIHSDSFRTSFRKITEEYTLPRHFDFVLLDPPWPSGSVKRKGNYEQVGGMPYTKKMLAKLDLDNYIEHNGLLGIWTTNKPSIREHILGPGGLFEQWNVGLIEEWIWIKTTTKGEPMFSIASEWRKPYEILLLGRAAPNAWTTMKSALNIKRRVIAAVPDVHSRKPCLKELIEPFLPNDYSALEVFPRNLIAGWTSWGDQVLKFNWYKYWAPTSSEELPM